MAWPTDGRTGERHHRHPWVGGQGHADVGVPGHQLDRGNGRTGRGQRLRAPESTSHSVVNGVAGAGLTTTGQPAASAGASLWEASNSG